MMTVRHGQNQGETSHQVSGGRGQDRADHTCAGSFAGVLVVEKNVLVITGYGWDATTRPQKGQKNRPLEQDDDE
jgi:hypothetical protein